MENPKQIIKQKQEENRKLSEEFDSLTVQKDLIEQEQLRLKTEHIKNTGIIEHYQKQLGKRREDKGQVKSKK